MHAYIRCYYQWVCIFVDHNNKRRFIIPQLILHVCMHVNIFGYMYSCMFVFICMYVYTCRAHSRGRSRSSGNPYPAWPHIEWEQLIQPRHLLYTPLLQGHSKSRNCCCDRMADQYVVKRWWEVGFAICASNKALRPCSIAHMPRPKQYSGERILYIVCIYSTERTPTPPLIGLITNNKNGTRS